MIIFGIDQSPIVMVESVEWKKDEQETPKKSPVKNL